MKKILEKSKTYLKTHEKQKVYLLIILTSIIGIAIRIVNITFESEDYNLYLEPWIEIMRQEGGLSSLKNEIGNYNIPYVFILTLISCIPDKPLYLIKYVSILFDFLLAASCALLVYKVTQKNKITLAFITYGITLILPTVFTNSAIWGQCDSIYSTFVILSLVYIIDSKYLKSFILLGIACSFKLQFIFIIPAYIIYLVSRKKFIKLTYFGIIPVMDFIMCLPAIIAGRSIKECMMIYISQTGENIDRLSMNFPSIYNFIGKIEGNFAINYTEINYNIISVILLGIICFTILMIYKKRNITKIQMIKLSLWSVCLATFILPHMHERYLYVGEILSVILAILDKKYVPLALTINIVSIITYSTYIYGIFLCDLRLLTIALGVCVVYITIEILKKQKVDYNQLKKS